MFSLAGEVTVVTGAASGLSVAMIEAAIGEPIRDGCAIVE